MLHLGYVPAGEEVSGITRPEDNIGPLDLFVIMRSEEGGGGGEGSRVHTKRVRSPKLPKYIMLRGDTKCFIIPTTKDPKRSQYEAYLSNLEKYAMNDNNVHKHIHEEKPKMNKFDTDEIKDSVMSATINMKNSLVQMKTGQAVIASIRASLKASPGVTPEMGILLDSKYADIAIGVVLSIAAPMVTKSTTIIKASQAAGFAGTMAAADKLSFIEEFIEKAIGVIPEAIAKVEGIMGALPDMDDGPAKDNQ